MDTAGWSVEVSAAPTLAAAALGDDPAWTAYALGDLEPPFAEHASVAVATSKIGARATCLTLQHPAFTFMITAGPAGGVRALLGNIPLPAETQLSVREEHIEAFAEYYDFPYGQRRMRRMVLDGLPELPAHGRAERPARLGREHARDLDALYSRYPESSFTTDHLDGGVFFGIREGGDLAAVAGTHVVSRRFRLAAIGSVFTQPESRGRGYGSLLAAAVARELRAMGCESIVLNVAEANTTASGIYERLGFRDHCAFLETRCVLKPA